MGITSPNYKLLRLSDDFMNERQESTTFKNMLFAVKVEPEIHLR